MAVLIGGEHNVCIYGPLRLWAERGLIHIEDARDNSYKSVSVRSELRRVQAVFEILKGAKAELKSHKVMMPDQYDRHMRMIEEMIDICRRAQVQGMPTDHTARGDLQRKRPTTVVMPPDSIF